uniref:exosome complex component RRP46 isoform X2 n=1 Tax=Myxine glutinosa TaxID=7769 RepID=UPI00358FF2B9
METCAAAGLHLPAGSCELSLLSRADGSASCSRGDTTVLAAVYGPAEVKHSREISDKATVEVILKGKCGFPGVIEKSQEHMIRGVVEGTVLTGLHPRTSITLESQALMTFVLDSKDKRILASHTKGSFLSSELQKCIAVSQTAADKLFEIYKHAITRRYSKTSLEASAPNLWST